MPLWVAPRKVPGRSLRRRNRDFEECRLLLVFDQAFCCERVILHLFLPNPAPASSPHLGEESSSSVGAIPFGSPLGCGDGTAHPTPLSPTPLPFPVRIFCLTAAFSAASRCRCCNSEILLSNPDLLAIKRAFLSSRTEIRSAGDVVGRYALFSYVPQA